MQTLNHLLSTHVLYSLGYTLLHTIWQGGFLAALTAVLLLVFHRQKAALRYTISSLAMVALVLSALGTFAYYYYSGTKSTTLVHASTVQVTHFAANVSINTIATTSIKSIWGTATYFVEGNLNLLLTLWSLGMVIMAIRFAGGLVYVQRLRTAGVTALGSRWQNQVAYLTRKAGYTGMVEVRASANVTTPLVIGWLKPIILLPTCAITGLSASDLEMILAHEVAHIVRKDYLVNLLQSVAEVLFFYHPAVWYLSAQMRVERENCCDDKALTLCGNPLELARALAALAELLHTEPHAPNLAVAALGTPQNLVSRVRRLVLRSSTTPSLREGVLIICLALALVAASGSALSIASQRTNHLETSSASSIESKTSVTTSKGVNNQTVSSSQQAYASDYRGANSASPTSNTQKGEDPTTLPLTKAAKRNSKSTLPAEGRTVTVGQAWPNTSGKCLIPSMLAWLPSSKQMLQSCHDLPPLPSVTVIKNGKKIEDSPLAVNINQKVEQTLNINIKGDLEEIPGGYQFRSDPGQLGRLLFADGLITNQKVFKIKANGIQVEVNGKPLPESLQAKYRQLLNVPSEQSTNTNKSLEIEVTDVGC
jgi:beta-lactamase regulating signal transducer with metallopeptidase domain